jgi:hypothetical protein
MQRSQDCHLVFEQRLLDPPSSGLEDGDPAVFRGGEKVALVVELHRVDGAVRVGQRSVLGSPPEVENLL